MSAAETTTDPVQEALSALVGATERLGRLAGEYLEAAQVAALRGEQTPQAIYDQMLDADEAYTEAFNAFQTATERACPKASVPTWQWARLDELEPGDLIHHGVLLPAGAAWLVVVEVEPDAGAFDSRLVVRVNSEGGMPCTSIVDAADVVVRRQVAAQRWSAADQQPIDLVPAARPTLSGAGERIGARHAAEGGAA